MVKLIWIAKFRILPNLVANLHQEDQFANNKQLEFLFKDLLVLCNKSSNQLL